MDFASLVLVCGLVGQAPKSPAAAPGEPNRLYSEEPLVPVDRRDPSRRGRRRTGRRPAGRRSAPRLRAGDLLHARADITRGREDRRPVRDVGRSAFLRRSIAAHSGKPPKPIGSWPRPWRSTTSASDELDQLLRLQPGDDARRAGRGRGNGPLARAATGRHQGPLARGRIVARGRTVRAGRADAIGRRTAASAAGRSAARRPLSHAPDRDLLAAACRRRGHVLIDRTLSAASRDPSTCVPPRCKPALDAVDSLEEAYHGGKADLPTVLAVGRSSGAAAARVHAGRPPVQRRHRRLRTGVCPYGGLTSQGLASMLIKPRVESPIARS